MSWAAMAYRCPACNAATGEPCVTSSGRSMASVHQRRRQMGARFHLHGGDKVVVELRRDGTIARRWKAPTKVMARRGFELLQSMEALASLDASGTDRGTAELPAFGCLDLHRMPDGMRAVLEEVHRAGFTTRIGCRYDVLSEERTDARR